MSENEEKKSSIPVIAGYNPIRKSLKKGETYYYCTCGKSKTQPFCDGAHQGTDFVPKAFEPEEDGIYNLCQCKHTANPPFCDGAHLKLG